MSDHARADPARHDAAEYIDRFVGLVRSHLDREFPHKLDHVMNDASEVGAPRQLHPIFYGSFDWHSSVHGHWVLVRALRAFPRLGSPGRGAHEELVRVLEARFTRPNVAREVEYLHQPLRGTFERTYGWAWLLKLAAELLEPVAPGTPAEVREALTRWSRTLQPLTDAFVERYLTYLPKATYPIRAGTHANSAFGLALAQDYARVARLGELARAIERAVRRWFLGDRGYHGWEPSGSDFLSPGLMEAECVRRVLTTQEFRAWFEAFMPELHLGRPATLFEPAVVSDRTDGQITHLDGLNLSRAWCFRALASSLELDDPRRAVLLDGADRHFEAAIGHVSGDYMGEHWLATFALLALSEG